MSGKTFWELFKMRTEKMSSNDIMLVKLVTGEQAKVIAELEAKIKIQAKKIIELHNHIEHQSQAIQRHEDNMVKVMMAKAKHCGKAGCQLVYGKGGELTWANNTNEEKA